MVRSKRGIELKSSQELQKMRDPGKIVALCHQKVRDLAAPGITGVELDRAIRDVILREGGTPTFYQYRVGRKVFPANSCISVNDEVVHGIPNHTPLEEGDIVSVDIGVSYRGFVGDAAQTLAIGKASSQAEKLMEVCRDSLYKGIEKMVAGGKLYDVSYAIQNHIESHDLAVVRQFVGHGIGRSMHEDPQVPNHVDRDIRDLSLELKPGLCLAIEPMVNEGTERVKVLTDGWTVATTDGKLSAHFEHTVAVTPDGPWILTEL